MYYNTAFNNDFIKINVYHADHTISWSSKNQYKFRIYNDNLMKILTSFYNFFHCPKIITINTYNRENV